SVPDHRIFQDLRVRAGELPGLEEWRPIDVGNQFFQRVVAQLLDSGFAWRGRPVFGPVGHVPQAPRFGDRDQRTRTLLVAVLDADFVVIGAHAGDIAVAL